PTPDPATKCCWSSTTTNATPWACCCQLNAGRGSADERTACTTSRAGDHHAPRPAEPCRTMLLGRTERATASSRRPRPAHSQRDWSVPRLRRSARLRPRRLLPLRRYRRYPRGARFATRGGRRSALPALATRVTAAHAGRALSSISGEPSLRRLAQGTAQLQEPHLNVPALTARAIVDVGQEAQRRHQRQRQEQTGQTGLPVQALPNRRQRFDRQPLGGEGTREDLTHGDERGRSGEQR